MNKNILYITYDGLSDPLGQSQIIPYLTGLADCGYNITILSCEKKNKLIEKKDVIKNKLSQHKIEWHYIIFRKSPPLISTISNFIRLKKKAFQQNKVKNFSIIHCRSYIASLIGLEMKKVFKTKFIFDMRGFWADERVEGGLWKLKNPIYKSAFKYFKRKEIEFFSKADYTICLTEKGKNIIHSWSTIQNQPISIQVIPCCVDMKHFSKDTINPRDVLLLKESLGMMHDEFILSYLGSLGTWYCVDEMLAFFKRLLNTKPTGKFLFITGDSPESIYSSSDKLNISRDKIIIRSVAYSEVPLYLSLSNLSLFFIKPSFSKQASSPTKMGEIMAMGIPLICNAGVGDTEEIIRSEKNGIYINNFSDAEYDHAIRQIENASFNSNEIRKSAEDFFSLNKGLKKYQFVYSTLRDE